MILKHLFPVFSLCRFQFIFSSIVRPRKLKSDTSWIGVASICRLGKFNIFILLFLNIVYFDFLAFSDNRFIFNHFYI